MKYTERVEYDGVQYIHGEAGTARTKSKADMQSTVQGHLHTQAYCKYTVGRNFKIFGLQVRCGIDFSSYAMAYAKAGKNQQWAVVLCWAAKQPLIASWIYKTVHNRVHNKNKKHVTIYK